MVDSIYTINTLKGNRDYNQSEFDLARSLIARGKTYATAGDPRLQNLTNSLLAKGYGKILSSRQVNGSSNLPKGITPLENELGMSIPGFERYLTKAEFQNKQSMPGSAMSIPKPNQQTAFQSIPNSIASLGYSSNTNYSPSPSVQTSQQLYNIKGLSAINNNLPYQTRGTIGSPVTNYIPNYQPGGFFDPLVALSTAKRNFAENVGGYVKTGVDEYGVPFAKKVGSYDIPVIGSLTAVKKKQSAEGEKDIMINGKPVVTKLPVTNYNNLSFGEELGQATTAGLDTGSYFVPGVGEVLLAGDIVKQVKDYKSIKVPTKEELILENKPQEFSTSEWKAYLKDTPEGQAYSKDIDRYISDVKSSKRQAQIGLGLTAVGLGIGGIVAGVEGVKYLKQPVKLFDELAPLPEVKNQLFGVVKPGDSGTFGEINFRSTKEATMGVEVPKYKELIGRYFTGKVKGKSIVYDPGFVSEQKLFSGNLDDVSTTALNFPGKRTGKYETYTNPSIYKGRADPILFEDINKLPKAEKYIAKSLLSEPSVIPEGTQYSLLRGQTTKGMTVYTDPVTGAKLKLNKITKSGSEYFIPTGPEVPQNQITGFMRVKPRGQMGDLTVFGIEGASKTTKSSYPRSMFARASGKVDKVYGDIIVLPYASSEESATNFITSSGRKSSPQFFQELNQEQAQKYASKLGEIGVVAPKPKAPSIKNSKTSASSIQEPYVNYPTYVGGLGRSTSQFYGKGKADLELNEPLRITPRTQSPQTDLGFQNLNYGSNTKDKELFGLTNNFSNLSFNGQKSNQDVLLGTTSKLGEGTKNENRNITVLDVRNNQDLGQLSIPKQEQPQKFAQPVISRELTVLSQPQPLRQVFRDLQIPSPFSTPRPPRPEPGSTTIFIPIKLGINPENKVLRKRGSSQLFYPVVRRYGKFYSLGGESSPERAIAKGKAFALTTLGASLKVKGPKGFLPLSPGGQFRTAKRNVTTLVQKRNVRLGSFGERAEIKSSRRRGRFKL